MSVTTTPTCRFGWQGQTLEYIVTATDADQIVVLDNETKGLDIEVVETKRTADGVEAKLHVHVTDANAY